MSHFPQNMLKLPEGITLQIHHHIDDFSIQTSEDLHFWWGISSQVRLANLGSEVDGCQGVLRFVATSGAGEYMKLG